MLGPKKAEPISALAGLVGGVGWLCRELPPTPEPHMLIAFSKEEKPLLLPSDWPNACPPPFWYKPRMLPSVGMTAFGNPLPRLRIGAMDHPPRILPAMPCWSL